MAAATIKHGAHRIFGGHHRSSNKSDPVDVEQKEKEKLVITDFLDQRDGSGGGVGGLPASVGTLDQRLGLSSRQLGIKDFKLLKTLGTGTFARVWLSSLAGSNSEKDKGKVFALKILRKADIIRLKQVEHIRNERSTLAAVNGHPFITTMITTFSDRDCLYMLLDYCPGGEVFTYLRRARRFDEETSRFYAAEIVLILEFLHDQHGIAYRDLKPENILIDAEGHLKLVDFGFAKHVGQKETYTLCGTPEYLAPEVIKNSGSTKNSLSPPTIYPKKNKPAPKQIPDPDCFIGHGTAVDWWAFGILLYEFLVGQPPFWDSNPLRIYELIVEAQPQYPTSIPATARDLISKLLAPNPSHRLGNISGGIGAIKSHEFFHGVDWKGVYERRKRGPIVPQIKNKGEGAECFDEYDPPSDKEKGEYTKEMMGKWEHEFRDF